MARFVAAVLFGFALFVAAVFWLVFTFSADAGCDSEPTPVHRGRGVGMVCGGGR